MGTAGNGEDPSTLAYFIVLQSQLSKTQKLNILPIGLGSRIPLVWPIKVNVGDIPVTLDEVKEEKYLSDWFSKGECWSVPC